MLVQAWLGLRIILQTFLFPLWAIELEIETLFLDGNIRGFFQRLRQFPAKLGVRTTFLVLGGYHRVRLEHAARCCHKSQDAVLRRILHESRNTAFGRDFRFKEIITYEDYVARIPVMTYAEHEPYIERQMQGEADVIVPGRPLYYATTSGTTGKPKYIPVTGQTARLSHRNVSLIWLYYLARRSIGFLNDELLTITGQPIEGTTPDGTPFGSTSGQLRKNLPSFMQRIYAVPEDVFTITDYDSRYYCLALFSLKSKISHIASANPSTLVLLFETIQRHQSSLISDIEQGVICANIKLDLNMRRNLEAQILPDPKRANELKECLKIAGRMDPAFYWPRLASIGCWKGGNSPVFIERLRRIIPDVVPIFDLGYLASEIRATVPVERLHHGGVPTLNRNFFEFVPVEAWQSGDRRALRLHELTLGERYYVLITTDSGLYRYHINDIVRVVGRFGDTPELVFEQKGDGVTNLTGEKLYEQQVQLAIAAACMDVGVPLRFYLCLLNTDASRYEFLVEPAATFAKNDEIAEKLLSVIDIKLGEVNIEYRAKRDSLRLKGPCLHMMPHGAFEQYRTKKVKDGVREAQFKMVLLSSKIEMLRDFEITASYPRGAT
jgi:hypothetical protein